MEHIVDGINPAYLFTFVRQVEDFVAGVQFRFTESSVYHRPASPWRAIKHPLDCIEQGSANNTFRFFRRNNKCKVLRRMKVSTACEPDDTGISEMKVLAIMVSEWRCSVRAVDNVKAEGIWRIRTRCHDYALV